MFCEKCGNELYDKFLEFEGMIPYCSKCSEYRFKYFNSAVSLIILNPTKDKMLFIKQYGTGRFRLVAGYTMQGESLEQTVYREMGEEIGRYPAHIEFNKSEYFKPSNTLMNNFICTLTTEELNTNHEIDYYEWVPLDLALEKIKEAKLAYKFVLEYFRKYGK